MIEGCVLTDELGGYLGIAGKGHESGQFLGKVAIEISLKKADVC